MSLFGGEGSLCGPLGFSPAFGSLPVTLDGLLDPEVAGSSLVGVAHGYFTFLSGKNRRQVSHQWPGTAGP